MSTTWMDIFKDEIDARVNDGRKEERQDTTVAHIRSVMESFGVSEERAMDSLNIPQNQREVYAGLVKQI